MATIHELLYQSSSFTNLKIDENIRRLVDGITSSYEISVDLDTTFDLEPIDLNINQAIPFSLIVNEVVTNVLKHAFEEGEAGRLSVSLCKKTGRVNLTIGDDGKGLPDDFDPKGRTETLGLELIEKLASQLKANYSYSSLDKGSRFKLSFEKEGGRGVGSSHLT
jgi:two-component sensor histidine kinase